MSSKLPEKAAGRIKPPSASTKIPVTGKSNGALSRSSSVSTLTSVADVKSEAGDAVGDGGSEFCVEDRIFVNGSKPGVVKFIGETQFAPGLWAGIMLDEAVGKNDGSVGGVRYFDCEPKRGIFTRPHRLTSEADPSLVGGDTSANEISPTPVKSKPPAVTPKGGSATVTPGSAVSGRSPNAASKLRVGERVVVSATSGMKSGTLRYVGSAEFAPGDWAGIELDEPLGKNDGSVAGKRYFNCKMKHGLFAPLHKVVQRSSGTATPRLCSAGASPLHQRSNSRESLNSSLSSSSAARLGRVKLGVTSLTNTQKSTRSAATTVTATNTALQEALKEKEEHIEQLLKERDLERAEVARAANQVDEAEQKLVQLQMEHSRYVEENEESITHLKNLLEVSDSSLNSCKTHLEEEKRKFEDLQFRLEEESIAKSDLETQLQQERQKIKSLEQSALQNEKLSSNSTHFESEAQKYMAEVEKLKALIEADNSDKASFKQQLLQTSQDLANLRHEASATESSLTEKDALIAKLESKVKAVTLELEIRDNQITELKSSLQTAKLQCADLLQKGVDQQGLQERICKLENDLNVAAQEKIESSKREAEAFQKSICEREEMLVSLRKSTEEKDSELQNVKKELQDALCANQGTEERRNNLNKEIEQLRASHAEILKGNEEKIKSLTEKLEYASQSLNQKEATEVEAGNQVTNLKNILNDKEAVVQELKSQLTEVEQKFQNLSKANTDRISSLEQEIGRTKEQNSTHTLEKDKEIGDLNQKLENVSQTLEEKVKECLVKEAEVLALKGTVEEKSQHLTTQETDLQNASKQIDALTEEKQENEKRLIEEFNKLKEESERNLEEKEQKWQQLLDVNKDLTAQVGSKDNLLKEKEEVIVSLEKAAKEKDNCNERLNTQLQDVQQQVMILSQDKSETHELLQKQIAQIRSETDGMLKEKDEKLQQLLEEIKRLTEEIKEKDVIFKQKSEHVLALEQNLKAKEERLTTLQGVETQLSKAQEDLRLLTEEKVKECDLLQQKISQMESENNSKMKEMQEKLQELVEENKHFASDLKGKDEQLKEKEQAGTSLDNTLKEKLSTVETLSTQLEDAQKELVTLRKEKSETHDLLQQQITQMKSETAASGKEKDEKLEGMQKEVLQLTQVVQEKTNAIGDRESKIKILEQETEKMKLEICELTVIIQDSQKKFEMLTEQNNKNASTLENRITEIKSEYDRTLSQKHEALKQETEKCTSLLKEKESHLQKSKAELSSLKSEVEEKNAKIKCMELQIEESRAKLQTLAESDIALHTALENKITSLQNQCDRFLREKEELARLQQESLALQKNLEKEKENLLKDNSEHKAAVQDREAKLDSVQIEVNRMKIEFANHKADLEQKLDVSEMELKAMQELKDQFELQHGVLEDLQKELQASENERNKLLIQLQKTGSVAEEKSQLEKKFAEVQNAIDELEASKAELEKQKHALEKILESNQSVLQQKEKELLQVNKQLEPLQKDAVQVEKLKITIRRLEEEKLVLEDKVNKLQSAAPVSTPNANISGSDVDQDENEALLSQVAFLNSIIVDMRNKNDELTARISILEAGPVFEDNDLNLNGIKRTAAPRLFCDICDMFDLHDTEDCPKQSSLLEDEEVPHSIHHGNRYEERPYCSNCEVFGHWTENCDESETF